MRVSDVTLKLCDQCVLATLDVSASSILQVVSVVLIFLLAYEYAVEH